MQRRIYGGYGGYTPSLPPTWAKNKNDMFAKEIINCVFKKKSKLFNKCIHVY